MRNGLEFSLALFSVGFLTTVLGSIMLYLSLRKGTEDRYASRFGLISRSLERIQESRRTVTLIFFLAAGVTLTLYLATLAGWIRW